MRIFLFKILFRFTWWIAPDKPRVNKLFDLYLELIETEEQLEICEQRQREKDACTRPRTETYEWLTDKKQRELYTKGKLIRGRTRNTRRDYTDYDEAQAYHDSR